MLRKLRVNKWPRLIGLFLHLPGGPFERQEDADLRFLPLQHPLQIPDLGDPNVAAFHLQDDLSYIRRCIRPAGS